MKFLIIYTCIYVYIYIYIYKERHFFFKYNSKKNSLADFSVIRKINLRFDPKNFLAELSYL